MDRLELIAATVLWLTASGCGTSDPGELISAGNRALGSGDSEVALYKFRAALAELEPGAPTFIEAKLGIVEALIPGDPTRALTEFRELGAQFPEQIGEGEFVYIAGQLVSSQQYDTATQLTNTAIRRFGSDSGRLQLLARRIQEETAANTPVIGRLSGIPCNFGPYTKATSK